MLPRKHARPQRQRSNLRTGRRRSSFGVGAPTVGAHLSKSAWTLRLGPLQWAQLARRIGKGASLTLAFANVKPIRCLNTDLRVRRTAEEGQVRFACVDATKETPPRNEREQHGQPDLMTRFKTRRLTRQ